MPAYSYMNKHIRPTKRNSSLAPSLDMLKVHTSIPGLKYKASRKPSLEPQLSHPLDYSDFEDSLISDTESDSCFDSSYNESISSVATNITSSAGSTNSFSFWNQNSLRQSAPLTVVSTTCIATYTPSSLPPSVTSSKLTDLLKKFETKTMEQAEVQSEQVPTYEFPQAPRISAWQSFSAFFINYSMRSGSRQDCGESFPEDVVAPEVTSLVEDHLEREMQTFSLTDNEPCDAVYHKSKARNRDYRVNNVFLRRYALDCSARISQILPNNPEDVEGMTSQPLLQKFDKDYGLFKLSELSRDKLWNSVILPPRNDTCPRSVIDSSNYIQVHSERRSSMVTKHGKMVPWTTHQTSVKPAGRLRTAACMKSETSPTLAHSTPQYTVRGWQNERWIPITISS